MSISYLPPESRRDLLHETVFLVGGCLGGILLLGIVVYLLTV